MATVENTIRYFPDASYVDLPTGAQSGGFLGGANRLETPSKSLTVEETGSRTFKSVILQFNWRDAFTVSGTEVTSVRMGIKLGAAAFADTDRAFTQVDTADHVRDTWELDVTDYFNTNFGAGTSQTCQCALEVLTDVAAAIGGTIWPQLIITYEFDDTVGTRRTKSVPLLIQSHIGGPGTTQVEIGTTGIAPAPLNQIPAFDTFFEETGKTIVDVAWVWGFNYGTGDASVTPFVQIDAAAEVAQGTIVNGLVTSLKCVGLYNYPIGVHSTATAHALNMRTDVAAPIGALVGGTLWVTFSYDANSARGTFLVAVPATNVGTDGGAPRNSISPSDNIAADALSLVASFDVQEPGVLTVKRSGIVLELENIGGGTLTMFAGSQPSRLYSPIGSGQHHLLVHRTDHSGDGVGGSTVPAWTIARGRNDLVVKTYQSLAGRQTIEGWMYVVYSADAPTGGVARGNRSLQFLNAVFGTAIVGETNIPSGGSQRPVSITAPWRISSIAGYATVRSTISKAILCQLYQEVLGSEWGIGSGWALSDRQGSGGIPDLGVREITYNMTRRYDEDSVQLGKMQPNVTRRQLIQVSIGALVNLSTIVQVHNIVYKVSGTLTISGAAAPDGSVVYIYEWDTVLGAQRKQYECVVAGVAGGSGAGAFSCDVFDVTKNYIAYYEDAPDAGSSAPALASTVGGNHSFSVGAAGSGYSRGRVVNL